MQSEEGPPDCTTFQLLDEAMHTDIEDLNLDLEYNGCRTSNPPNQSVCDDLEAALEEVEVLHDLLQIDAEQAGCPLH